MNATLSPGAGSNQAEAPAGESRQQRILVFEDDQAYGHALDRLLQGAGYRVQLTAHFGPALEALEHGARFDLLLADIVASGGVNGMALSRMARMRQMDIKILYLTGYDLPGAEHEALGPILRKPITNEALLDEVARVLAG